MFVTACVACLAACIGALASPVAAAASAVDVQAAPVRYRVVNLGSGTMSRVPQINSAGQVAFSLYDGIAGSAWIFDGRRIIKLGTLGGSTTYTSAINESGQVAGWSSRSDEGRGISGAFRWTAATGMVDLGSLGDVWSRGYAINNKGDVAGGFGGRGNEHAFRWTFAAGMENLGTLFDYDGEARAINDAGLVAGVAASSNGRQLGFVWTRDRGIEDIGSLGGQSSVPVAVGAHGEVAGASDTFGLNYNRHAFLWTRAGGMRDLGALDGTDSYVTAMSPNANIIGRFHRQPYSRVMVWTPTHGMVDLGTLGGASAQPGGINSQALAVGSAADGSEVQRAFAWTRAQGMTDLNTRLVNAPAGLVLTKGEAVSDNGAIVASSNAGLVLLRPLHQEKLPAPVVGPIQLPDTASTRSATDLHIGFTDANPAELHRVTVDWGDAFMDTALVTEKAGEGSARAHHLYQTPGLYSVMVRVSDSAGNTTSLRRDLIVAAAGQLTAGSGRLQVPAGADPAAPQQADSAAFRFLAPGVHASGGMFSFVSERLRFRATSMSQAARVSGTAGVQQMAGTGQLNDSDGYHYRLSVSAATSGQPARFGLRIWHIDPVSRAEVTDFDNVQAGGSALTDGAVAL